MIVHVVPPKVKAPFISNGSLVILKAFSYFYFIVIVDYRHG